MSLRSVLPVVLLVASSCVTTVAPHPRALECNELCALAISKGDLQTAEDQCDLGLQFSPQYADLWTNKGIIEYSRSHFEKSKEYLIKALRLNNNQAQAYNNLGVIYLKELAYGKAHDNFQAALHVNPDYLEARLNLAISLIGLKKTEEAKKELRTLTLVNPNLSEAWAQLGRIAFEDNEFEEARPLFEHAVQLEPKYNEAWTALGNTWMELGKPCEGKDAYSTCIENDSDNAQCRNNIIIAEKKCRLQDKALEDVKGRAAGTKTPETEYTAALQAREKGLVNDEERAYKRCLKYDPKFALCHFGLFEMYKNRSDEKNATVACKNFIKFASASEFEKQIGVCQQYVRD
jgi:tetratricopeptide (TPR) repeat protein